MKKYVFPKGFTWGTATASYQIEGAVKQDGRGETIWDRFCQNPANNKYGETGERACDHYNRYKEDVRIMKDLGMNAYRFSIAWSRIQPTGRGEVNKKGLQFYSDLIDELLKAGIEPFITLYHWDLPQKLQDIGGWTNREIPRYFEDYCRIIFGNYGDRVTKWITLNEPKCSAYLGYAAGMHAPGYKDYSASLEAAYNLLCAHGRAVKLFRDMKLKGDIGITIDHQPYVPFSDTDADRVAARNLDGLINRLYFDPVFKGKFPQDVLALMEKKGCTLPEIREEDLRMISQKIDFLGINYYFINHVRYDETAWPVCADVWPNGKDLYSLDIPLTDRNWTIEPDGLTETLMRMKNEYAVENIYITENGASFNDVINIDGEVVDDNRIDYLRRHLEAAYNAILAGVNLKGYFVWSLTDNYEWNFGKYSRFGLVYVDFETQRRTIKKSGYWFRDVVRSNGLD